MKRVLIIAVLFLAGCGSEQHSYTDTTTQGYKVDIPDSVYTHGLYLYNGTVTDSEEIRTTLLDWVDYRVNEWMQSHPERSRQELFDIAYEHVFVLYDHWGFKCSQSSTGMCRGLWVKDDETYTIYVATYVGYVLFDSSEIGDSNFAPHTLMTPQKAAIYFDNPIWASMPIAYMGGSVEDIPPRIGCIAIPHELNHAIWGDYHG